jgi:hypothetical protein
MSDPLFVMTSKGYINLTAVIHIDSPLDKSVGFYFGRSEGEDAYSYCVNLPEDEGEKIINLMRERRPDWFVGV